MVKFKKSFLYFLGSLEEYFLSRNEAGILSITFYGLPVLSYGVAVLLAVIEQTFYDSVGGLLMENIFH